MRHLFTSILITGGSSGIGRALALEMAAPGVTITVTGRNEERIEDIKKDIAAKGAIAYSSSADVRDQEAMSSLIADCEQRKSLDLVVANAGVAAGGDTSADAIHEIFNVNLSGVLNTIMPVAEIMRARRKGHVAIVSSVAGFRGLPTAPAYSASKVAVRAWGEALRPHLTNDGVALSLIFPGFVESRITDANNFPMPWIMPAERAAKIIVNGLNKQKRTIAFPWQMVCLMRLITALPAPIFERLLSRAPKKA